MKPIINKLDNHKSEKMRYTIRNPHNYHVAIIDNLAPEGANVVKCWNDKINLTTANNLCDAMNYSWHIKRENQFLN